MRIRTLVTLALLASLSTACASDATGDSAAKHRINQLLRGPEQGSSAYPVRHISQALPGSYLHYGGERIAISDVVALGEVTKVEGDTAFVVNGATDSPVPFSDPAADGRYALVTMHVDGVVCATDSLTTNELKFRLVIAPDDSLEEIQQGFDAMGKIIVFLKGYDASSPRGVYDAAMLPGLLSEVNSGGRLPFAAAHKEYEPGWFDDATTVSQLKNACAA